MTTTTTADLRPEDYDTCLACDGVRDGSDRFFCASCLDTGAPEQLLKDNPILSRNEFEHEIAPC